MGAMSERSASKPHTSNREGRGSSPYSTGGGGYTFERRVAVTYLARLLTGETAGELQGRRVRRVSFQQAPEHKVDDLVVTAAGDDGCDRFELEIAVRRAPKFTASDDDSKKLIGSLLASVSTTPKEDVGERLAICVAGPQTAARQVSELAGLAKQQATASRFHSLIRSPGKFSGAVRSRLDHLVKLVTANLLAADVDASPETAKGATWKLLRSLEVLMPRLETSDETDWIDLANRLQGWAREPSVAAAMALRDRLKSLADTYAPAAADIDLAVLRRDAHEQIHLERRHREVGWKELRRLDAEAKDAVRTVLGLGPSPVPLHLCRVGPVSQVRKALSSIGGVLVTGDSGTGKSALVLNELADAATSDPLSLDVVFLNLRQLPTTMTELRNALGAPLEELLAEMSTPTRLLVLDAADVTIERDDQLLAPILRAAQTADVTPWIICATEARNAVRAVAEEIEGSFSELVVGGLDDSELEAVAEAFPQLRRLLDEPRAKELLRRPGVIDLFVRSENRELPLSDADAFRTVWSKLVRKDSRDDRGSPHARDEVLRQLARQQLLGSDEAVSLDAAAVTGLQRDSLLRPADPWKLLPEFTHDLVRTYSVVRVLLSKEDLVQELIAIGAPRWALPATRIAVQVLLSEKESLEKPRAGRLVRLQAAMDRLPEAGHGDRWSDLPTEAVLTLPESEKILGDAWPSLVESRSAGLRRVLRVIQQRHSPAGITDSLVAEPLVELLLEHGCPLELDDMVNTVMRGWLRGLVRAGKDAGHPLRIALRERLVARVAEGDKRLVEIGHEQEAKLAARTQEEVAEAEERIRARSQLLPLDPESRRPHREWRELPLELTDKELLEQLALLGADLGDSGEALLRRVAADAPRRLLPALEGAFTGHGISTYDLHLLIYLTDAYYIEEIDDYAGTHRNGIREHMYLGSAAPQSAAYLGPFQAMLRADPLAGVACLNRLLNHAAQVRVQTLRDLRRDYSPKPAEQYAVELDITGERRRFVGDEHVWMWYRGIGGGPYPCMSALQALEFVCDDGVRAGVPLERLFHLLLQDCKNLAMPGLIVGMLVRHLERVESELDPFLAAPEVWRFEFARTINESLGYAAQTEGVAAPDRRKWHLRDAATRLTLSAADDRIESLRAVGQRLVERAMELEGPAASAERPSEMLATVRNWAGSLDRDTYKARQTDNGVLIEQVVDKEIIDRLAPSNTDLSRSHEASRLMMQYPERYNHPAERAAFKPDELLDDLKTARGLAENPPPAVPGSPFDAPAAVAAAALEARFLDGMDVPLDDLAWAAALLVGLGIQNS